MANKDAVGRQGPAYEMAVERGKIREFARATASQHAEYLDDERAPIPPTFLTTSSFWQPDGGSLRQELDLDLRRLLHGEQEFVFFGEPPRAGDRLTAQARVESVFEKEGKRGGAMTFVSMVTDFTDGTGRLVAQSRATLIETGRPPA